MAILKSIKTDEHLDILYKLGVEQPIISALLGYGVKSQKSYAGFAFIDSGGKIVGEISIPSKAVSLLEAGIMGPASKEALKATVESKMMTLIADLASSPTKPTPTFIMGPLVNIQQGIPVVKSKEVSTVLELGNPIDLAKAKNVMQVVYGTSEGHTYKVVAILDGLAVAIRCNASKMSVRVAGNHLDKYTTSLKSVGFNVKSDSYASVHYEATEVSLRIKTIGAILASIGLSTIKEVADLSLVLESSHG